MPLDDRDLARRGKWREVRGDDNYMGTALVSRTRGASLSSSRQLVEVSFPDKVRTARYIVVVVSRGRPVTIDGFVVLRE
jgi:hypothetical protein